MRNPFRRTGRSIALRCLNRLEMKKLLSLEKLFVWRSTAKIFFPLGPCTAAFVPEITERARFFLVDASRAHSSVVPKGEGGLNEFAPIQ